MHRILGIVGMVALSSAGWWLGARVGLMTGFVASAVGAGLGLYLGRRLADHWS
jgi:hypothetical protein